MTMKTGMKINAQDFPPWAVVDKETGSVITFAETREWAREFADHNSGERIAKVTGLSYEVSK